jgi:predicted enzyme related to lactoylglutathione lyase
VSETDHERQEEAMAKVVHFEIPFEDKARAMTFYTAAFDWHLTDMPQMDYVLANTVAVDENQMPKEPGAINGGLTRRNKEASGPVVYVDVPSIDEAIVKVHAAGGKVVTPKTPIPNMGAFARVSDTEGNVIGLFSTNQT